MKKTWSHGLTMLVISGMACVGATAWAQDIYWDTAVNGSFGDQNRWDPAEVPEAGARAIFDRAGDYTVTLHDSHVIGTFQVRTDTVTLDLAGHQLFSVDHLFIASQAEEEGLLRVANTDPDEASTFQVAGDFWITGNNADDAAGRLIVEGPNTVLTSSGSSRIRVGADRGAGELIVRDGATVNHSGIVMQDTQWNAASTVRVESGGNLLGTGSILLSWRMNETLHIRGGGTLTCGYVMFSQRGTTGTMIVEGVGTTATTGILEMARVSAVDEIRVLDGGSLTSSGVRIHYESTSANAGQVIEVSGASSTFTLTNHMAIGGSHATTGDAPGHGTVTVSDGGKVIVEDTLFMHSRAVLEIDGGTVEAQTFWSNSGVPADEEPVLRLTLHDGMQNEGAPLAVTGNVTFGDLRFELGLAEGFSASANDVFDILSFGGTRTGTFLGLADGATVFDTESGYEFEIGYGGASDDVVTLTVTMIPEPGTLVLLLAGAGLLAARRRVR